MKSSETSETYFDEYVPSNSFILISISAESQIKWILLQRVTLKPERSTFQLNWEYTLIPITVDTGYANARVFSVSKGDEGCGGGLDMRYHLTHRGASSIMAQYDVAV